MSHIILLPYGKEIWFISPYSYLGYKDNQEILIPDGTMSDLTSLPDHEEPHKVAMALVLIFVVVYYVIHFGLTRVSCLHANASWLIRIQSGFNPHPEVD